MKKHTKTEPKSPGTVMAEKARAKANTHSDEKRAELLERGMAMIYGGSTHAKSPASRR